MSQPTTSDVHIPTADRKKTDTDLTPTSEMVAAAQRALEWRRQYGRGGTMVGVARARDIANGKALSPQTIARMVSFFARHGSNRAKHYELRDGKPTTWRIAWDLWGGDPARNWANRKQEELMNVTKANHSKSQCMSCKENPPTVDVLWNGGQSRAWFCDKCFGGWSLEKGTSIVNVNRLTDGVAPARYKVNHSPNEKRSASGQRSTSRSSGGRSGSKQSGGKGNTSRQAKEDELLSKAFYLEKQEDHTTAMIALFLPKKVAETIAVKDGLEPDDLHITLVFLGEANAIQDLEALKQFVAVIADMQEPLNGVINGIGKFSSVDSDGLQAFYVSPDLPDLPSFRQHIFEELEKRLKLSPAKDHGFIPHITLKYLNPDTSIPFQEFPQVKVTFSVLTLMVGNVRFDYPLKGNKITSNLFKINGNLVTLADLAQAWLAKEDKYTSAPWKDPAPDLSPQDYAKVCLIDLNETDFKIKANCKLPYKATPSGPININALRAIAGYLPKTDAPPDKLKEAAAKLVRMMRGAGIEPGEATLERAGIEKSERIEKAWEFEEVTKDAKRQIVYGVILRPFAKDKQGDVIDPEEIMSAAHIYMAKRFGAADLEHKEEISRTRAMMVESFVAGADLKEWHGQPVTIAKGSWVGGMWIPDKELWQRVERGEIGAFSIRGWGKRTPHT